MLNVTKELTALARKLGYEGKAPDTVAKAINAITSVAGEGGGSGDGCDCEPGYEKVETELFSETVTTSNTLPGEPEPLPFSIGALDYDSPIEASSLTVTFDDSTYTVPLVETEIGNLYGGMGEEGPDFSTYPFCIISDSVRNTIYTETAGTYNVAASAEGISVSNDFANAVNASIALPVLQIVTEHTTWQEVYDAIKSGKIAYYVVDARDNETVNFYFVLRTYVAGSGKCIVELLYYNNNTDVISTTQLSADSPTDPLNAK